MSIHHHALQSLEVVLPSTACTAQHRFVSFVFRFQGMLFVLIIALFTVHAPLSTVSIHHARGPERRFLFLTCGSRLAAALAYRLYRCNSRQHYKSAHFSYRIYARITSAFWFAAAAVDPPSKRSGLHYGIVLVDCSVKTLQARGHNDIRMQHFQLV